MTKEEKMKIVINNYFKTECSVNTSIREAFEKGFRIGVQKGISAQPEPQWIPCSERLPEIGGLYIVCGKQKYTWENDWSYFVDAAECVEPDEGYIDCWTTWNDWDEGQENHIIAWMPLP